MASNFNPYGYFGNNTNQDDGRRAYNHSNYTTSETSFPGSVNRFPCTNNSAAIANTEFNSIHNNKDGLYQYQINDSNSLKDHNTNYNHLKNNVNHYQPSQPLNIELLNCSKTNNSGIGYQDQQFYSAVSNSSVPVSCIATDKDVNKLNFLKPSSVYNISQNQQFYSDSSKRSESVRCNAIVEDINKLANFQRQSSVSKISQDQQFYSVASKTSVSVSCNAIVEDINKLDNFRQVSSVSHFSQGTSSKISQPDNYDEELLAFVKRINSPSVKSTSYENEVSGFIERNNRYCRSTAMIYKKVDKFRKIDELPYSSSDIRVPTHSVNLENLAKSGITLKEEICIKQEYASPTRELSRASSLSPERVLENFCSEKPESWEYTPSVLSHSDSNNTLSTPINDMDLSSIKVEDTDSLKQFNQELPGSWVYNSHLTDTTRSNSTFSENVSDLSSVNAVTPVSVISVDTTHSLDSESVKNHGTFFPGKDGTSSYVLNRSPSPERKYLHLIRSSSRSPERKFLEKLNSKSRPERRRYRSRSISISPPRRRTRSRSRSPQRYKKSQSSVDSYKYSRSSVSSTRLDSSDYSRSRSRNPSVNRNRPGLRESQARSVNSCHRRSYERNNVSTTPTDKTRIDDKKEKQTTEREALLKKYTKDYCSDINEMRHKMNELSKLNLEELIKRETQIWSRMSPANLFYQPSDIQNILIGTAKLDSLCKEFEDVLVKRAEKVRATQSVYVPPARKKKVKFSKHKSELSSCSSSNTESDTSSTDEEDCTMEELERKQKHPHRLHPELWFNEVGDMNDGPLCRCSAKARRSGIRHNIYAGELSIPKCCENSNNANTLHHYRITISPPTNFLIKTPTIISHDDHEFIFEGFSMFSHIRLDKLPVCKVIRFNIEYTILYFEERMPENFTVRELDLFYEYVFKELLELVDLDFKAAGDKTRCAQFHFMPRFVRELPENGKEILSMNEVLLYLLKNSDDLVKKEEINGIRQMPRYEWQKQVDLIKGMVVTLPGMKPCSLRVDQLDRDEIEGKTSLYPEIVHFGIRPPQLSYAGNPEYQKAWREYVKFRHLLANMPKPSFEDKRRLEIKEIKLQEMRTQSKMKRDITVTVNSEGFKKTGIMCDIVQHAMLIPVLVSHLRFHCSLGVLEETICYKFKNRYLLQLALTHPSYRENFGTNPDHARNSLTNCGIRQPEYGDRRIHYMNTRKRGINTLINIMSRFGKRTETESNITHNERLEFLGDAVVEFITSIHLFHMFPELEEGGLATYRAAIVQNQHLAVLAKTLKLDEFMLYAHGSDLCHDLELRHAMANCFEALMGALFLDGGIDVADKVFGETLFNKETDLLDIWVNYPPHPLQEQEPLGDRKWIPRFELLKKLTKFEESIGIEFTHVRLLARAFTDRSIGYTNLTLGSNQRLEFLGDTVLQLIASEYLYRFFPEHHEGHLSLLRSSLVNNRTQAVVCNDLGMTKYALYHNPKAELKTKDRADLLEAFLGALYVDKGLEFCEVFCNVCFFPRLQMFIMRQDWNDPKSKLQQCCLTLRTMEGGEPEIPIYKVIECMGPTNTRVYTVAVYFKGRRLAEASGHSIQQAEMNAAKKALQRSHSLFPQLDHQKRVIAKSVKTQHGVKPDPNNQKTGKTSNIKNQFITKYKTDSDRPVKKNNRDIVSNDKYYKKPVLFHGSVS